MSIKVELTNTQKVLRVLLPFALGFLCTCVLRTMNAVMMPDLVKDLGFEPSNIGLFTSTFFLAYGLFQFPLGILLDRYGARKIQYKLFILAGISLILFAHANSIFWLCVTHIMVGIGIAGGLMSALKSIVQWFPQNKIAWYNAVMMTSGGAGILFAATPTQLLTENLGWRSVNILYGCIMLILAIFIFFFVPEQRADRARDFATEFNGLIFVLKDPFFWSIAPLIATSLGSFIAFQGLWIEGWMLTVQHLSQTIINEYLLLVGIGMTVALLFTGKIPAICARVKISVECSIIIFSVVFLIDQGAILWKPAVLPVVIWFVYGFASHIFNLCYAIYANYFPKDLSARANAAQVLLTYFVVFVFQYFYGIFLSIRHNQVEQHKLAFFVMMILQLLSLVWFVMTLLRQKRIQANV